MQFDERGIFRLWWPWSGNHTNKSQNTTKIDKHYNKYQDKKEMTKQNNTTTTHKTQWQMTENNNKEKTTTTHQKSQLLNRNRTHEAETTTLISLKRGYLLYLLAVGKDHCWLDRKLSICHTGSKSAVHVHLAQDDRKQQAQRSKVTTDLSSVHFCIF